MRLIISILTLFVLTIGLSYGQVHNPDGDNSPVIQNLVDPGTTYTDLFCLQELDETNLDIEFGEAPEGDFLGRTVFTREGERILLTNRMTDNITVFDASTFETIINIEVGYQPCFIDVSDDYAVVSCSFDDMIYVIDLDDYSTAATFETAEQPWTVHINDAGTRAYVACDIPDQLEVIDLENLEHVDTFDDFPISLYSFGANTESGRSFVKFTEFEILPGTDTLMVSDQNNNMILFINGITGEVDETVEGITACRAFSVSGNGEKAVAAISDNNVITTYQIDLGTYTISDSLVINGYNLSTYQVGVNFNGSKGYLGISNNSCTLFDFEDDDYTVFTETQTAFWVGVSNDFEYAISGQYRFTVVDFENEDIAGSLWGYSQYFGCVSPVDDKVVGFDPTRHEGIYFYDFSDPGDIQFDDSMVAGEAPESDAPRRAAISPDGSMAVVTNVMSDNASIVDLETNEIVGDVFVGDRVHGVAITSDSRWAVVCGMEENSATIIDLETYEEAAIVELSGTRPSVVSIHPDDTYAYIGNVSSNTISVIELDGENSSEIEHIFVPTFGVAFAAYSVTAEVEASPAGDVVLVACSHADYLNPGAPDEVAVIDANDHYLMTTVTVGDLPMQVAFTDDGERAIVTNYLDSSFSLLDIDGENTSVIESNPTGQYPLRVEYNPFLDEFAVCNYSGNSITMVDAQTGMVVGTEDYSDYDSVIQVDFNDAGDMLVLTGYDGVELGRLHHRDGITNLPATPSYFAYNQSTETAIVTMPGPDWITRIDWEYINHAPSPFSLILPADMALVSVEMETFYCQWEESSDPDPGEEVVYNLYFSPVQLTDTTMVFESLTETEYMFDPMLLVGTLDHEFESIQLFNWWVEAISGEDTVTCDDTWSFLLEPVDNVDTEHLTAIPSTFSLSNPYPNPFNSEVKISFSIPTDRFVSLSIYDLLGREVEKIVQGRLEAGWHNIQWRAGNTLTSGIYLIALEDGNTQHTSKVIYLK